MINRPSTSLVTWLLFCSASMAAQQPETVTWVRITVSDLEKSIDFYTQVSGFETESCCEWCGSGVKSLVASGSPNLQDKVALLRMGEELIEFVGAHQGLSVTRWLEGLALVVRDPDGHAVLFVDSND